VKTTAVVIMIVYSVSHNANCPVQARNCLFDNDKMVLREKGPYLHDIDPQRLPYSLRYDSAL